MSMTNVKYRDTLCMLRIMLPKSNQIPLNIRFLWLNIETMNGKPENISECVQEKSKSCAVFFSIIMSPKFLRC